MKHPRRTPFAIGFVLLMVAAPFAQALAVFNHSATVNERFSSGFPLLPVANTNGSFIGTGLDFSGVGWLTANSSAAVTLISPQHFVTAAHVAPSPGATVKFFNGSAVMTYTVDSLYTVTHTGAVNTDMTIGRLTAPISGGDAITYYPTLLLNSFNDYLNLPLIVYGAGGRIGANNVDNLVPNADMLPFGGGDSVADSALLVTEYNIGNASETQGEVGDSGSPTFYVVGNTLALLGVHSAVSTGGPSDLTLDSFIPSYAFQIDDHLNIDLYSLGAFTAIPEPATYAMLTGILALGGALWRRKN